MTFCVQDIDIRPFEGYTATQYQEKNPNEYAKLLHYKNENCRFWYKYKNGESPFDVNVRANLFLMKIKETDVDLVIIISHLFFLKMLEMNLLGKDIKWVENAEGFNNTEIHIISEADIEHRFLTRICNDEN